MSSGARFAVQQDAARERLGHIVVGAELNRVDHIFLSCGRAADDDGNCLEARIPAHEPQQFESTRTRQSEIQKHDLHFLVLQHAVRLFDAPRKDGLIPFERQEVFQDSAQRKAVFDDQNFDIALGRGIDRPADQPAKFGLRVDARRAQQMRQQRMRQRTGEAGRCKLESDFDCGDDHARLAQGSHERILVL